MAERDEPVHHLGRDARLNHALRRSEQATPALAALFLDLDGFKPINDRHGHATGDALLCIVGNRLRVSMHEQYMVCRLGDDEFACILHGPGEREQLSLITALLIDAVSAPIVVAGLRLKVRPSMGIVLCPVDGDSAASWA